MSRLSDKNLIVVDIETTGTNPFKHDAVALAFAPLNEELPRKIVYVRHHTLVWNEFARRNFEKFAAEWSTESVSPSVACDEIEAYIARLFGGEKATLVGHNIGFDIAFLRKLAFQGGRDELSGISHRAIDTHTLLYVLSLQGRIPDAAVSSEGALSQYRINVSVRDRHTANGDADATRSLVLKLLANFDVFPDS